MKKTFSLLVVILAVSLLLPVAIFADQAPAKICAQHPEKTCFTRDNDYYCNWTETVTRSKVTRGRAGLVELVPQRVAEVKLHKCADWEHPTGR